MTTDDFFHARINQVIDMAHPPAFRAGRMPWVSLQTTLARCFARGAPAGAEPDIEVDLFVAVSEGVVTVPGDAGRSRLPIRLMISLLYLKHALNLSDEQLVARWSENVVWQYFSGQDYYEPRLPCDSTRLGHSRAAIGEAGVEEILKATIDTAVEMKAIKPVELERVIVDTTVQPKVIAHPIDSRLLEAARRALVKAAGAAGIELKQTFAKEGKHLRWKTGRYGHARQFRRLAKVARRQRTIVGRLLREIGRKAANVEMASAQFVRFGDLLARCERIRAQGKKTKGKPYALHAPEVECIAKGKAGTLCKAGTLYEFGVKAAVAVTPRAA